MQFDTPHALFDRSGPGPLGPVRKILVVRSGPEGPQFSRSVGTLAAKACYLKTNNHDSYTFSLKKVTGLKFYKRMLSMLTNFDIKTSSYQCV